jgi:hypothetical protein
LQQELIKQTIVLGRNEDIARLDKIYVIDLWIILNETIRLSSWVGC